MEHELHSESTEDVLKEVSVNTNLVMADDGVELMNVLIETIPPVLSMPAAS